MIEQYRRLMEDLSSGRIAELTSITALCAIGELDELELHLERAKEEKIAANEVLEAILININYSGLLKVGRGIERFMSVFPEGVEGESKQAYPDEPDVEGFHGAGLNAGTELYGSARARANFYFFRGWDRHLAEIVERVIYGGLDRRRVLSHLDRELCSVGALTALGHTFSLEWHARVALQLGAMPDEVRGAAIRELPHVGFPLVVTALLSIDNVVEAWTKQVRTTMAWD
jgi:alkylhydroperoxidase/carboxymuconolactone decarboxylase family protein YurZ